MKCYLLYFTTDNAIKLMKKKIKDGVISFKDKAFDVEKTRPYFFEIGGMFGFGKKIQPLYIVTPKNARPYRFEFEEKKLKERISPENYKEIFKQQALKEILKAKGMQGKDMFMFIVMGAAMGAGVGFILATLAV